MNSEVEVTQEDRDAAAALHGELYGTATPGYQWIIDGSMDDEPVVQAFARHRIAALRQSRAAAVDDEQTVERVAKAVRFDRFERTGRGKAYDPALPLHETELADARAALRALAPQTDGGGA